jgi:hypothetical protein
MIGPKLLVVLVCLAAGAASCGGDSTSDPVVQPPPAPPPPPPPPPAPPPPSRGSEVTWTWRGGTQHNVTFEDGNGSSSSQTSGTHDRTFSATGTFRYRCTLHSGNFTSGMVGSVVVQ